jgi:hypothetical protein
MKVSELIEILKPMPQDLKVFGPSEDGNCDYWSIREEQILIVDKNSNLNPIKEDICVIGDWYV